MRAAYYNGVGDVTLGEAEKPKLLPGTLIVHNIRSGICGTDLHAYGVNGPEVGINPGNPFGHEMSGVIDAIGEGVEGFSVGQRVFVNPVTFRHPNGMSVLESCDMAGAFTEYVRVEDPREGYNVFTLPDELDWDVAAMTEPISVALYNIEKCAPKPGDKVIIYGGGIIGLCALACLRALGIDDVIVNARNDFRLGKIAQMGGIPNDTRVQSTPEFAMERWGKLVGNNGEDTWAADVVIDCGGWSGSFSEIFRYAKSGSTIGVVALGTSEEPLRENDLCFKDVTIQGSFAYTPAVNSHAIELMTAHQDLFAPIATQKFPLSKVSEAFETAADSTKAVKVLLDMER